MITKLLPRRPEYQSWRKELKLKVRGSDGLFACLSTMGSRAGRPHLHLLITLMSTAFLSVEDQFRH